MKYKTNILITFAILLILCIPNLSSYAFKISNNEKTKEQRVTIKINNNGLIQIFPVDNSVIDYSIDEAEQLKNRFLLLEKSYSGLEKIKEQLKILREINVIPSEFNFDLLLAIIEKMKNSRPSSSSFLGLNRLISGPMIISHFTINGRIKCILPIRQPKLYYQILNQSGFEGYVGVLPLFLGYSFNPVFITAFGPNIPGSFNRLYLNFVEFLCPCIGMTIAFIAESEDEPPDVIFEYNLDICLFGTLQGLSIR